MQIPRADISYQVTTKIANLTSIGQKTFHQAKISSRGCPPFPRLVKILLGGAFAGHPSKYARSGLSYAKSLK